MRCTKTQPKAQPVGPVEAGVVARVVKLLKKSGEQNFASWNPIARWLKQLDTLRTAA